MERLAETRPGWALEWQESWDRLQEAYVADRERRISVLVDAVDSIGATALIVIDLACGTGTVTRRLLDRLPSARVIAVDIDPVLLAIASATFSGDDRVRIVRADLRERSWAQSLPESQVDVVVTATALHWLPEEAVRAVYSDLVSLIRVGGVFAHSEQMPLVGLPRLAAGMDEVDRKRRGPSRAEGRSEWDAWWDRAGREPALRAAAALRRELFGGGYPREEFSPSADWHISALTEAGFAEVGVVWRSGSGAVVAALR